MDNTQIAVVGAMLGAIVVTAAPYLRKKYWEKKVIPFDYKYLLSMVLAIGAACWAVWNGIEGLLIGITPEMNWVTALLLGIAYGGSGNTVLNGAIKAFLTWWNSPSKGGGPPK